MRCLMRLQAKACSICMHLNSKHGINCSVLKMKTAFLLLGIVVLASACIQQPTGKVVSGNITRIIDGDTLEVDGAKIRLVLVDAPERSDPGGSQATRFAETLCPPGSPAVVDQDDRQLYDSYGRMLAVVWCGGKNLNEELLSQGYAKVYYIFCGTSEFGTSPWAKKYGC